MPKHIDKTNNMCRNRFIGTFYFPLSTFICFAKIGIKIQIPHYSIEVLTHSINTSVCENAKAKIFKCCSVAQ
jgi:hypothetical protein